MFLCVLIEQKGTVDTEKQSIYSYVKFYKKDNDLHEIYFTVWLEGLKRVNTSGENSNTSEFNEIKIILIMFTESLGLYLGMYTNLIIGNWENIFQVLTDLINHCFRVLIISHFSFLIALLSVFLKTYLYLYAAMSLI